jgi:hypothetical protein
VGLAAARLGAGARFGLAAGLFAGALRAGLAGAAFPPAAGRFLAGALAGRATGARFAGFFATFLADLAGRFARGCVFFAAPLRAGFCGRAGFPVDARLAGFFAPAVFFAPVAFFLAAAVFFVAALGARRAAPFAGLPAGFRPDCAAFLRAPLRLPEDFVVDLRVGFPLLPFPAGRAAPRLPAALPPPAAALVPGFVFFPCGAAFALSGFFAFRAGLAFPAMFTSWGSPEAAARVRR